MANKSITYDINMNVNKKGLDDLKTSLDSVISKAKEFEKAVGSDSGLADPYKEAAVAAKDLKDILNSSWNSKTNQLDFSKVKAQIESAYGSLSSFKSSLSLIGAEGQRAFSTLSTAVLNTQAPIKQTSALLDKMSVTMANTIRFGISSSIFNNLTSSVSKAYNYVKKLDNSLNNIRIVSGQSAENMERFALQANAAAASLGSSTLDYTDAALIYFQQGITDVKQIQEMTDITIKMSNVTKDSAEEVSSYMTAIWNNFNDGSTSLEHFADVITALGASTASSSAEIAEGLEKFASIGETVGLSYEYATAALATVVAQTRQSADTVGTAFKTLFARIEGLKLGDTLEDGTTLNKYSEALNKVGINIKDQSGQLRDMDNILEDMGNKWKNLSRDQQVALAQTVAGTRQYAQLVALMDNWDTMQTNLITARSSEGSLNEQQEIYMESVDAHLDSMATKWEALYENLIDEDVIKVFADALAGIATTLNTFVTGMGGGLNTLIYLMSTLSNLMSDRLAVGILRVRDNMDAAAKAAANLKVQQEFLAEFSGVDTLALNKSSVELYARELATSEKLAQYKSQLSEKEQEALVATTERLKQLHEEEEIIKNIAYHKADASRLFTSEEIDDYKKQKKYGEEKNRRVSEKENSFNNAKERNKYYEKDFEARMSTNQNKINANDDLISDLQRNVMAGVAESAVLTEQQLEKLSNTYNNLNNMASKLKETEDKLTEDGKVRTAQEDLILKQVQSQRNAFKRQLNEINKVRDAKGELADIDTNEIVNALQTENAYLKHNVDLTRKIVIFLKQNKDISKNELRDKLEMIKAQEEQERLEREQLALKQQEQKAVSTMISLTSSMITTISAVGGAFKTLFNPDLTIWEKFTSILSVIAVQSLQLISTFKDFGDSAVDIVSYVVTKQKAKALEEEAIAAAAAATAEGSLDAATTKKTASDAASTGVTKLKTKAEIEQAVANGTLSASNLSLSGTFGVLAGAVWTALAPLLPFIAAGAAIAAIIGGIAYAAGQGERELQSLKDAEEGLTKRTQELTETIDNLNQSWDKYDKAKNALSACSEYTDEWNNKLQEVNDSVLEIIDKYPELLQMKDIISRDEKGVLSLDKEKFSKFKENKENQLEGTKQATIVAKEQIAKKEKQQIFDQGPEKQAAVKIGDYLVKYMSEQDIKKYAGNEKAFNEDMKKYFSELGYSNKYIEKYLGDGYKELLDIYGKVESIDTTIANTKNLNAPKEITEAGGHTLALYNKDHKDGSYVSKLAENIRNYEKDGVSKISEEGDEDALTFMRNYVEANGLVWDESKFTNVDGDDEHRKYFYDGLGDSENGISANEMSDFIATQIQNGNYKWQTYKGWTGDADVGEKSKKFVKEDTKSYIKQGEKDIQATKDTFGIDDEGFIQKILTKDVKKMNTEELEFLQSDEVQNKISKWAENIFGKKEGQKFADSFIKSINNADMKAAAKNLEDEIEGIYKGGAEELGVSTEELKTFADMIVKTGKGANLTKKELAKLAVETKRYSKNLQTVGEALENNKDTLDEWAKGQKSIADPSVLKAVSELRTAINDTFKVSIDEETLKKNYDTIKKAINGDKKALLDFQKLIGQQELVAKFRLSGEDLTNAQTTMNNFLNQYKDLEIGAEINLDTSQYLQDMNNMMEASGATAKQIQEYYNNIGYEPEIEEVKVHVESIDKEKGTFTDAEGKQHPITSEVTVGSDVTIPIVKKLTKSSPKKFKTTTKDKKGGKGGGKNSEPQKSTKEKDRYQKVNENLDKISRTLAKLQKQEERLIGSALVKNLISQLGQLDKQLDKTKEKMGIAGDELVENRDKLKKYGVTFDKQGQINNYSKIWDKEEKRYNEDAKKYAKGKLSEKAWEKAQERWDNFEKEIQRYDELFGSVVPQLEQQLEDDLSKEIEIKIKVFDTKVNLTLELDDMKKQWLDFKKNVLEDVKDDDYVGQAKYAKTRYEQLMNDDSDGSIKTLTTHLNGIVSEGQLMDQGEISSLFGATTEYTDKTDPTKKIKVDGKWVEQGKTQTAGGNDWKKWTDELKETIENLEEKMTELDELQEQLHDNLISQLGLTKAQMDKRKELYDAAINDLEHNLRLVQIVYGENAYAEMEHYYESITDTYDKEYQKAQGETAYWKNLMDTYVEGTEEWENARDNWIDSVQNEEAALESYLESVTNKYLNAINKIFDEVNNKITNGKGLEYINEEWNLINKNADMYLDTINAQFGIQQLQNKYMDAIDNTSNVAVQQKLTDLMNEQVDALQSQDKLSQYDLDRANKKYEIALKQIELEEAQMNKSTMRLRRDSQGNYTYQYAADEDKLSQLKDELSALQNELYNLDKDAYKENLNQLYDIWAEYQEKMKEAAQINDPKERKDREELLEKQYGEIINNLVADNEELKQNLYESTYISLVDLYGKESDAVRELEIDQEATMSRMIVGWNSHLQQMADSIRDEGGFTAVYKEAMDKLKTQQEDYQKILDETKTKLEEQKNSHTSVKNEIDKTISTQDKFIEQAQKGVTQIQGYIDQVGKLAQKYKDISDNAKQALIDAEAFSEGIYKKNIVKTPGSVKEVKDVIDKNSNNNNNGGSNDNKKDDKKTEDKKDNSTKAEGVAAAIWIEGSSASGWGTGSTRKSRLEKKGVSKAQTYLNNWTSAQTSKWQSKKLSQYHFDAFDTGGYTGDWAGEGRFAMLHQKELVLNAHDTENLLNAVAMMREMTQSMLSGKLSAGSFGAAFMGQGLQQDVHIEASFPNVTSHNEIEQALNNLVNVAAQRVQEK